MAVKIRLMRIGTNSQPFYRVVAVDERKKRTGGYLELLGTYNPLTQPKEINLDQGKIDAWIKKGAVASHGFLRIIGKAPQRLPRKAKKAPKEQPSAVSPQPSATETEQASEETPVAEEATQETQPTETQETAPVENTKTPEQTENPEAEVKTEEEKPSQEPEKSDS